MTTPQGQPPIDLAKTKIFTSALSGIEAGHPAYADGGLLSLGSKSYSTAFEATQHMMRRLLLDGVRPNESIYEVVDVPIWRGPVPRKPQHPTMQALTQLRRKHGAA